MNRPFAAGAAIAGAAVVTQNRVIAWPARTTGSGSIDDTANFACYVWSSIVFRISSAGDVIDAGPAAGHHRPA
jgi:hypothetical protein